MTDLLERKLLFVTGKGGVGKTTVAAALALLAAERGKRTLVCEFDAKGNLADFFESGPTKFQPREITAGLFAMSMDPEESLKEYLTLQLRLPLMARIGPLARIFEFVATAAPGVREVLTVGKVVWEVREKRTGTSSWSTPAPPATSSASSPRRRQSTNWCRSAPSASRPTGWSTSSRDRHRPAWSSSPRPEEMPVNETIELAGRLEAETNVDLAAVDRQPGAARAVRPGRGRGVRPPGRRRRAGRRRRGDVEPIVEAARLAVTLRRSRAEHLDRLREALPPDLPMLYLPVPVPAIARDALDAPGGRGPRRRARATDEPARTTSRSGSRSGPAPARAGSMEQLFAAKEIVIACGSGGVGKTTTAAAVAAMAAVRLGGRVLVLTVDPARRLANALGLEGFGNVEKPVPLEAFADAGVTPRGELWAAMLDTKQSWDNLVMRHAPDEDTAQRILENPLYQNISGRFVQSHDYIAMERLFEIHTAGQYDLIVVDTPPTRNALDLLEAPKRMADFFSSRFLRLLIAPYRSRLVNMASRPFYQVADRILGSQFLQDIAEFFILFQTMYDGLRRSGPRRSIGCCTTSARRSSSSARWRRRRCTRPSSSSTRWATSGSTSARSCSTRCCRRTCSIPAAAVRGRAAGQAGGGLAAEVAPRVACEPALVERVLTEMGENFLRFQLVAQREAEQRAELAVSPEVVATVPYFESDIHDLGGLAAPRRGDLVVAFTMGEPVVDPRVEAYAEAHTTPPDPHIC